MKKNITAKNVYFSIALQLVTIISGFIIPKLILSTFGSEVNGLVSSLKQVLNYAYLLEGGISGVVMASLYKPLYNHDEKKVSGIINATSDFFKKICRIFIIYTIGVAFVYPIIVKSSFSYGYVCTLAFITSFAIMSQLFLSITWKLLLQADKKVWYAALIQIICIALNNAGTCVLIKIFPNIHVIKLFASFVFLLQPILFNRYVKKHYAIDETVAPDKEALANRWNGLGINIAAFIHNNTDETILSLMTSLTDVSIYEVYRLVVTGLRSLVNGISNGVNPTLGEALASKNKKRLNKLFDVDETVVYFVSFFLFTVGGLLITPFVMIYTKGITDTNYYQPFLGWALIVAEFIYCIRDPYVGIAYSANKYKELTPYAIIEAAMNVAISVALVPFMGINSVAIGTIIAMAYRTIMQVNFLRKNILNRSAKKAIKKFLIFSVGFTIVIAISRFINVKYTIVSWLLNAIILSAISFVIYAAIVVIFYKEDIKFIMSKVKKRK